MSTTDMAVNSNKSIAQFGSREDVHELKTRLIAALPGGKRLNDTEIRALAQASIAHELDPFNGELWIIPGSGLMIGIKGLRKKAHQQIAKAGGNYWTTFHEIVDEDWLTRHRIPEGALCYEARLFDSETIRTFVGTVEKFQNIKNMPWEVVQGMVGSQPYTSGYGVFRAGESTKMEPIQCVQKRAEADAIKRRFDVPFGMAVEVESEPDASEWVIDEEVSVESQDATADETASRLAARCTCDHIFEEHGIGKDGPCEIAECDCKKFTDTRLAKGKKALGRDGGGID